MRRNSRSVCGHTGAGLQQRLLLLTLVMIVWQTNFFSSASEASNQKGLDNQLMAAVASGDVARTRRLLARGARPIGSHGRVLFMDAAMKGNFTIAELLLDHGDNVNRKEKNGNTVLINAVVDGAPLKVIKFLLQHGARVNDSGAFGLRPLHAACYTGQTESGYQSPEVVRLLIAHGANVNAHAKDGETPLMVAASTSSVDAIKMLLDRRARIDARDSKGRTALMHAAYSEGEGVYCNPESIRLLIARGANVNLQDKSGDTALMWLARIGPSGEADALRAAKNLIAHGAGIETKNRLGKTALEIAEAHGLRGLAQLLREPGAAGK